MPVFPDFSAIRRSVALSSDHADAQTLQLNVGFNLTQNNCQNQTQNRDMNPKNRPELTFRSGKVGH